jgi:hypothetical protein
MSAWRYSVAAVIWPRVTQPFMYAQPPTNSKITSGLSYASPRRLNKMFRSAIVYRSA